MSAAETELGRAVAATFSSGAAVEWWRKWSESPDLREGMETRVLGEWRSNLVHSEPPPGSVIRCTCGCNNVHIRAQDGKWMHVEAIKRGGESWEDLGREHIEILHEGAVEVIDSGEGSMKSPYGPALDGCTPDEVIALAREWHQRTQAELDKAWEAHGESTPGYEALRDDLWEDAPQWLSRVIEAYDRRRDASP